MIGHHSSERRLQCTSQIRASSLDYGGLTLRKLPENGVVGVTVRRDLNLGADHAIGGIADGGVGVRLDGAGTRDWATTGRGGIDAEWLGAVVADCCNADG